MFTVLRSCWAILAVSGVACCAINVCWGLVLPAGVCAAAAALNVGFLWSSLDD